MGDATPTLPRLFLGEALRQLRDDSGLSLDAAAAHIGKNRQRLIRLLEGKATLTRDELARLVEFLGADRQLRHELVELGDRARSRNADGLHPGVVEDSFRRIAYLEAMAESIRSYEKGIFPALLQSPEYVAALMDAGHGIWWDAEDEQQREERVAIRLRRQQRVLEEPADRQLHLLFTDDALDAVVGDRQVMRRQCAHVVLLLERHRNLTVQVVPVRMPGNPAQQGGLSLFGFGGFLHAVGSAPGVYGPATYFDAVEDTRRLELAFGKLCELALSADESAELIRRRAAEDEDA